MKTDSPPHSKAWVAALRSGVNATLNVTSFAKTPWLIYAAICDGYAWLREPDLCESAPPAGPIVAHIAMLFVGSTLWLAARIGLLWWEGRAERPTSLPGSPYRLAPHFTARPRSFDRAMSWAAGCDAVVWFASLMLVLMPLVYPDSLRRQRGSGGVQPCASFREAEELRRGR